MFTIKHIIGNDRSVYSCDWYRIIREGQSGAALGEEIKTPDRTTILLYSREKNSDQNLVGPFTHIDVIDGDSAYIENASGKTVDMIRYAGPV